MCLIISATVRICVFSLVEDCSFLLLCQIPWQYSRILTVSVCLRQCCTYSSRWFLSWHPSEDATLGRYLLPNAWTDSEAKDRVDLNDILVFLPVHKRTLSTLITAENNVNIYCIPYIGFSVYISLKSCSEQCKPFKSVIQTCILKRFWCHHVLMCLYACAWGFWMEGRDIQPHGSICCLATARTHSPCQEARS